MLAMHCDAMWPDVWQLIIYYLPYSIFVRYNLHDRLKVKVQIVFIFEGFICRVMKLVNRPGVAGAVLQTPLYFIDKFSNPFPPNLQKTVFPKL